MAINRTFLLRSFILVLVTTAAACAATVKIIPVPCLANTPDVTAAPNETNPRVRQIAFTNVGNRNVTVYALVETNGFVNPDSVMVCGLDSDVARQKAAEAMAKSVFYPATGNGIPIRKWAVIYYKMNSR